MNRLPFKFLGTQAIITLLIALACSYSFASPMKAAFVVALSNAVLCLIHAYILSRTTVPKPKGKQGA